MVQGPSATLPARVTRISLENGTLEFTADPGLLPGEEVIVEMMDFPHLTARVTTVAPDREGRIRVGFSFSVEGSCRDKMIVKLYTGGYSQDIRELDRSAVVGGLWKRAFGSTLARSG
jgi:cellulose synthase (UDP-forming)